MQIKVNGVTISVENSPVTTGNLALDNLEKQSIMLSRESEDITKMIKLYDIMSDVKAVESFGYRSTEGVGEKIANAAKEIWEKIKKFFESIATWFKNIFLKMKDKIGDFFLGKLIEDAIDTIKKCENDWEALKGLDNKTIKIDKCFWSEIKDHNFNTFYDVMEITHKIQYLMSESESDYKSFNKNDKGETIKRRIDRFSDNVADISEYFEKTASKLKSYISNTEYIEIKAFDFWNVASSKNTLLNFIYESRTVKEDIDKITKSANNLIDMIKADIITYTSEIKHQDTLDSTEISNERMRAEYVKKTLNNFNIITARTVYIMRYLNKLYDNTFRYVELIRSMIHLMDHL